MYSGRHVASQWLVVQSSVNVSGDATCGISSRQLAVCYLIKEEIKIDEMVVNRNMTE